MPTALKKLTGNGFAATFCFTISTILGRWANLKSKYFYHLAVEGQVSASTQNRALSVLLFLYRIVRNQELVGIDDVKNHRDLSSLSKEYCHIGASGS